MRLLPLCLVCASACAPTVFITRPIPPSVGLPPGTTTVMVEPRSSGSVLLDLVQAFSSSQSAALDRAAVDAVALSLNGRGIQSLVACTPPCSEAQAVVSVSALGRSLTQNEAVLELEIEVTDRTGAIIAQRSVDARVLPSVTDESAESLARRALEEAASRFTSALFPSELRAGYRLATGNGLDDANALLVRGDSAGAIAGYRAVVASTPSLADAHYNLAVALTAAAQDEAAYQSIVEAARLSPAWYAHRVLEWKQRRPAGPRK